MRIWLITIPLATLVIGCSVKSERECYEANQAVASAIDKTIASKIPSDGMLKSTNEWAATHIAAMKWRATVCKE